MNENVEAMVNGLNYKLEETYDKLKDACKNGYSYFIKDEDAITLTCIAVGKQIAKAPENRWVRNVGGVSFCPTCKTQLFGSPYCPNCGQHILTSEEGEEDNE